MTAFDRGVVRMVLRSLSCFVVSSLPLLVPSEAIEAERARVLHDRADAEKKLQQTMAQLSSTRSKLVDAEIGVPVNAQVLQRDVRCRALCGMSLVVVLMVWSERECSAVEWSGVEWSGVEWSGVEWSGVEWQPVSLWC